MPKVTITKDIGEIVVITTDYGTATSGMCIACNQSGWLDGVGGGSRYGYPFGTIGQESHLVHAEQCPVNVLLRKDGTLKYSRKKRK